jgi:hypothetical protein
VTGARPPIIKTLPVVPKEQIHQTRFVRKTHATDDKAKCCRQRISNKTKQTNENRQLPEQEHNIHIQKLSSMKTKTSFSIVIAAAFVREGESFTSFVPVTKRWLLLSSTWSTDPSITPSPQPAYKDEIYSSHSDIQSSNSWSVADDWTSLSKASTTTDNSVVFDVTYDTTVANDIVSGSDEDIWIQDIVDEIHNSFSTLVDHPPLYDTSFDEPTMSLEDSLQNEMDDEIAMLIRCNEQPQTMLIAEGRALPPLTQAEMNEVSQLVIEVEEEEVGKSFRPTEFLKDAVSNIFRQHATPSVFDGVSSMDRAGIASWMTICLQQDGEGKVTPHDQRVLKTMSEFSRYGTGRIVEEDFQDLYLSTLAGDISNLASVSAKRHLQLRKPFIDAVWRDIRAHGILAPVEEERLALAEKLRNDNEVSTTIMGGATITTTGGSTDIVDECEILEWNGGSLPGENAALSETEKSNKRRSSKGLSSHKLLELADDGKTPLRMRDGEFGEWSFLYCHRCFICHCSYNYFGVSPVFIDEESCIGCMMCANVAPAGKFMLDSKDINDKTFAFVLPMSSSWLQHLSCWNRVELEIFTRGVDRMSNKLLNHVLSRVCIPYLIVN